MASIITLDLMLHRIRCDCCTINNTINLIATAISIITKFEFDGNFIFMPDELEDDFFSY